MSKPIDAVTSENGTPARFLKYVLNPKSHVSCNAMGHPGWTKNIPMRFCLISTPAYYHTPGMHF